MAKIEKTASIIVALLPDGSRPTIGDVREWFKIVEDLGFSDSTELLECYLSAELFTTDLAGIGCGDCVPMGGKNDILVVTHRNHSESQHGEPR
jgi:hypothetical protein